MQQLKSVHDPARSPEHPLSCALTQPARPLSRFSGCYTGGTVPSSKPSEASLRFPARPVPQKVDVQTCHRTRHRSAVAFSGPSAAPEVLANFFHGGYYDPVKEIHSLSEPRPHLLIPSPNSLSKWGFSLRGFSEKGVKKPVKNTKKAAIIAAFSESGYCLTH